MEDKEDWGKIIGYGKVGGKELLFNKYMSYILDKGFDLYYFIYFLKGF